MHFGETVATLLLCPDTDTNARAYGCTPRPAGPCVRFRFPWTRPKAICHRSVSPTTLKAQHRAETLREPLDKHVA